MNDIDTLILGGGQAGLALSHCLTALGLDHLVVERGRIAERWHSERWSSLRLLTPNWMTRLPGWAYDGPEPDGFMTATEVASFFGRYAASFDAPVLEHTTVQRVAPDGDGFAVATDDGPLRAQNVVIATGWCDRPAVPAMARQLPSHIHQVAPSDYRRPDDLPSGGVLVVGASATGVQLAHELHASGRAVTLAVGRHSRMPRRYRGMDVFWWLDQIGILRQDHRPRRRRAGGPNRAIAAARRPDRQPDARPHHPAGRWRPSRRPAERRRRHSNLPRHRPASRHRGRRPADGARARSHRRRRRTPRPERRGARRRADPRRGPVGGSRHPRSAGRRDQLGRLGYRLPPAVRVAPAARTRSPRRDPPVPRCDTDARRLRARPTVPALPQLQLHRRCRSGRASTSPITSTARRRRLDGVVATPLSEQKRA